MYKVKTFTKGMVLDFSGNSSCCSWRISWGNSKDKNSAEKTSTSSKEATSTSDKTSEKASSESQAPKEESKSADEQYQAILDEYTQKLKKQHRS